MQVYNWMRPEQDCHGKQCDLYTCRDHDTPVVEPTQATVSRAFFPVPDYAKIIGLPHIFVWTLRPEGGCKVMLCWSDIKQAKSRVRTTGGQGKPSYYAC